MNQALIDLKKTIRDWLRWLAIRAFTWGLLYLAVGLGLDGAGNVLTAWIVVATLASCLWLTDASVRRIQRDGPSAVPQMIRTAQALAFSITLVWHGWWVTSVLAMVGWLLTECAVIAASKMPAVQS